MSSVKQRISQSGYEEGEGRKEDGSLLGRVIWAGAGGA